MRDVYLNGGNDWKFGNNKSSVIYDNGHINVDVGYGDVYVYWRPSGSFTFNEANQRTGYNGIALQCSVLESVALTSKSGVTPGVAYVYAIPAFFKNSSGVAMSAEELKNDIDNMYGAKPISGTTNCYQVEGCTDYYRYAGDFYYNNDQKGTYGYPTSFYVVNTTAHTKQNSGFKTKKGTYLFVIGEGPTEIWLGTYCSVNAIIYTPHKSSKVYFGHESALGTSETNPGDSATDTVVGGSLVTGQIVMDWGSNNGSGWYIDSEFKLVEANATLLSKKLYEGVSTFNVENDSETTRTWEFTNFE